jgi:signal transduction histidine kinase
MELNFSNLFGKSFQTKNKEVLELDRSFLLPLSVSAIIFSAVSLIVNVLLGFDLYLIAIPVITLIVFVVVYYLTRIDKYVAFAKWLFLGTVFVFINLIWYFNYGSHGPWFYLIILLYSYLIFMMAGRQLLLVSLVLIVNVVVLFVFEYHYPDAVGSYPTKQARIIDTYMAILLYGAIAYVLMTIAKRLYLNEYQKAKESERLKSSFLANMSHEIRTPLNTIVGFSNLLADDEVDEEEKQQYVEIINQSNTSLLRLIDDVLDVSLIDANQMKISAREFELNQLFDNMLATYRRVLVEKEKEQLSLELMIPDKQCFVQSDQARISQVMVNLIDNALKFTHQGKISFGYKKEGAFLHFFVFDTGIGIAPQYHDALFERFFKIEDDQKALYRGTGIGLYLCKRIVQLMDGEIWFESKLGEGSKFHFKLPAKGYREVLGESLSEIDPTEKIDFDDAALLIVEDDEDSLLFLSRLLENMGLRIRTAANGEEALEIFRSVPDIELVLLDIQLPDTNGFELLKDIRRINGKIPVIAQTAFAMTGDEAKCYEAGFTDYIAKPIPKDLLIEKLSLYLNRKA